MSNLGSESDVSLVLGCGGYLASDISEITTTMMENSLQFHFEFPATRQLTACLLPLPRKVRKSHI